MTAPVFYCEDYGCTEHADYELKNQLSKRWIKICKAHAKTYVRAPGSPWGSLQAIRT